MRAALFHSLPATNSMAPHRQLSALAANFRYRMRVYKQFDKDSIEKLMMRNLMSHILDRIEVRILLRSKFRDAVLSGTKRGTLRMGRRVPESLVIPIVLEDGEVLGHADIEVLIWLRFKDLEKHPQILEREYPREYDALVEEMKSVYQDLQNDSWLTFYGFKFTK